MPLAARSLLRNVAFRAALGRQLRLLRRLRRHDRWSRGQIESWQVERLKRLLVYCAEQVPYYRQVFRERGFDPKRFRDPRDLKALPVLTRDILLRRRDDLVSRQYYRPGMAFDGTGGSTGRPIQFTCSRRAKAWALAAAYRAFEWTGVELACPKCWLWGHPREDFSTSWRHNLLNWIQNQCFFNAFSVGEPEMDRWYRLLCRFQPELCSDLLT